MDKWITIINSLLSILSKDGFLPVRLFDGEELINVSDMRKGKVAKLVAGVDESTLTVENLDGRKFKLLIVLGNSPCETVADFTYSEELEKSLDKFYQKWESWN